MYSLLGFMAKCKCTLKYLASTQHKSKHSLTQTQTLVCGWYLHGPLLVSGAVEHNTVNTTTIQHFNSKHMYVAIQYPVMGND